jgi:hypothetical protein
MLQNYVHDVFHTVGGGIEYLPVGPLTTPRDGTVRQRPYNFGYFLIGLFLSSVIVTSIGTFLIIRRILSTTRENPSIANIAPYRNIQHIVIESGVIYTMGMLSTGIAIAIFFAIGSGDPFTISDSHMTIELKSCIALTYSQALLIPLSVGSLCSF